MMDSISATYIDDSGSMGNSDFTSEVVGKQWYFNHEVSRFPTGGGGTNFGAVLAHARNAGYRHIRVVTDGFGEFDASKQPPQFDDLKIDWVLVDRGPQ